MCTARTSRGALLGLKSGGKHWADCSIEQALEVARGVLPRELKDWTELPPKWRKIWMARTASATWPTPTASESGARNTKYAQGGTPLSMAVRHWPTPQASDTKLSSVTVAAHEKRTVAAKARGHHKQLPLPVAIKMYPTPMSSGRSPTRGKNAQGGPSLPEFIRDIDHDFPMNPAWTEMLMGFPPGWTEPGPPPPAKSRSRTSRRASSKTAPRARRG